MLFINDITNSPSAQHRRVPSVLFVEINSGFFQDLPRLRPPNTHIYTLAPLPSVCSSVDQHPQFSPLSSPPGFLALTLLVFGILADHTDNATPLDDLALFTHLLH